MQYLPGKQNMADTLSHLGRGKAVYLTQDAEEFIWFVAVSSTPEAMSVQEFEEELSVDLEVLKLRECMMTREWDYMYALRKYKTVRDELSL